MTIIKRHLHKILDKPRPIGLSMRKIKRVIMIKSIIKAKERLRDRRKEKAKGALSNPVF
ncbi:MAG: hypothetical protein K8I29_19860 [Alphaproteobacteria bacterium]|uniref:Uncharacterized protein n=1 Tax=Candidatus Nitrobium versatile TaxID=2884831 RepID=A0A953M3U5_9BACT|nr:hypothetical protein [Candidatus Nitrobium versatile]